MRTGNHGGHGVELADDSGVAQWENSVCAHGFMVRGSEVRQQGALHGNTLLLLGTSHPSKGISDTFVCVMKKIGSKRMLRMLLSSMLWHNFRHG